jgi:hypothetical protein
VEQPGCYPSSWEPGAPKIRNWHSDNLEAEQGPRELKKQIGGPGDKFGCFTEYTALPSMEQLLHNRFDIRNISPRHRVRRGGKAREYDVLSWANGKNNSAAGSAFSRNWPAVKFHVSTVEQSGQLVNISR